MTHPEPKGSIRGVTVSRRVWIARAIASTAAATSSMRVWIVRATVQQLPEETLRQTDSIARAIESTVAWTGAATAPTAGSTVVATASIDAWIGVRSASIGAAAEQAQYLAKQCAGLGWRTCLAGSHGAYAQSATH